MKVKTGVRPFPFFLNLGFALFCLGGAIWGAYDYWIWYPEIERANQEHRAAAEVLTELGDAVKARARDATSAPSIVVPVTVSEEDLARYRAAQETIERIELRFKGPPRQLAAWDRPLQLWLWVIGCGVLGFPFFAWPLVRMMRSRWELSEDGTLRTPTDVIPLSEVTGIDMSRWCAPTGSKRSTWKAWLLTRDGRRHELDDHDYRDMHLIIGFYAHHFHPESWTPQAKRVKAEGDEVGEGASSDEVSLEKAHASHAEGGDGGHGGDGGGGNGD
ncbi:MAG: hypothetical protein KF724_02010 [Phycisphaeraceae bacterium]|nr:hypothetical protein [Phycisphaeraceae bacterium]